MIDVMKVYTIISIATKNVITAAVPYMHIFDGNIWNGDKAEDITCSTPALNGCIWLSSDDNTINTYK